MSAASSPAISSWIPRGRIRLALGLAVALALVALVGGVWSRPALVLLVPAAGAGWAAFVMWRIRQQLSTRGGGWQHRIHELVLTRLAPSVDAQLAVLDIGCGDASLLVALLGRAPTLVVTGVDFWGARWDYAQAACESRLARLGRPATFQRMDAARLALADASFDVVVSVMCFHEVRTPAESTTRGPLLALSEALRVLRPGGRFVLVNRFRDSTDYGESTELDRVLDATTDLRRERLVATLGVPWPLSSARALGPVDMLSGCKRAVPPTG